MPRKADERAFGFRTAGILRILAAADPEQVLDAVEELGFRLPDRAPIDSLTKLILETHKSIEEATRSFILESVTFLNLGIFELEEDPAPGEARAARALRQLKTRQEEFLLDLARKREEIEKKLQETTEQIIL